MKRIFEKPIVDIVELRNLDILCASVADCFSPSGREDEVNETDGAI